MPCRIGSRVWLTSSSLGAAAQTRLYAEAEASASADNAYAISYP